MVYMEKKGEKLYIDFLPRFFYKEEYREEKL